MLAGHILGKFYVHGSNRLSSPITVLQYSLPVDVRVINNVDYSAVSQSINIQRIILNENQYKMT